MQVGGAQTATATHATGQTGTFDSDEATVNPKLPTGEVELRVAEIVVQSADEVLPMQVAGDEKFPEDIRLKYRLIDLRRD